MCKCSEMDWTDVDMTAEHHPDCKQGNYRGEGCPPANDTRNRYTHIEWIPVSERVPDNGRWGLVAWADQRVRQGFYNGIEFCGFGGYPVNATHWAELPEAPKGV